MLRRICPACGNKALPVTPKGRHRIRTCLHCARAFSEYNGIGCLTYPVILSIGFGTIFAATLLLGPYDDYFNNLEYILLAIYALVLILSFVIPIILLNLTIPIRLADKLERKEQQLQHKDKWPRFTVTYIVLMLLGILAFSSCMETFFLRSFAIWILQEKHSYPK
jgi:hypothetical protein